MTIQVTFMKKVVGEYDNIINFCAFQILFVSISYLSVCRCLFIIINYLCCTLSPLTHNNHIIIIIMSLIYNIFILIFDLP